MSSWSNILAALLLVSCTTVGAQSYSRSLGQKQWETSNHLGNVVATTSDRKVAEQAGVTSMIAAYESDVVSYGDYYPYGMLMEGRGGDEGYRFGFNGMERDDETYDQKGNSYTTFFRKNDVRLGRWLSYDPKPNVSTSPYAMMDGNPIWHNDVNGDTIRIAYKDKKGIARWFEKKKYHNYEPGSKYSGNNTFIEQVTTALNYVFESDESQVITRLSESKEDTEIIASKMNTYHYGLGKSNTVYFNPSMALGVYDESKEDTGEFLSPSLFLYHELAHAFIKLFYTEEQKEDMKDNFHKSDRDTFHKPEEKEVINKFEIIIAEKLNQPIRKNHLGVGVTVESVNEFNIKN